MGTGWNTTHSVIRSMSYCWRLSIVGPTFDKIAIICEKSIVIRSSVPLHRSKWSLRSTSPFHKYQQRPSHATYVTLDYCPHYSPHGDTLNVRSSCRKRFILTLALFVAPSICSDPSVNILISKGSQILEHCIVGPCRTGMIGRTFTQNKR
jgi:hypothetical protein